MKREDILQHVVRVVHESFGVPVQRITGSARLFEDLGIDSIDAVDLIVQMRCLVGPSLQPRLFREAGTVDDIVNAVERALSTPPHSLRSAP